MLFEHQVFHALHDKLGAGIHHSGEQTEVGWGERGRRNWGRKTRKGGGTGWSKTSKARGGGQEDRVRLVVLKLPYWRKIDFCLFFFIIKSESKNQNTQFMEQRPVFRNHSCKQTVRTCVILWCHNHTAKPTISPTWTCARTFMSVVEVVVTLL